MIRDGNDMSIYLIYRYLYKYLYPIIIVASINWRKAVIKASGVIRASIYGRSTEDHV
jgi:hypothetical protein